MTYRLLLEFENEPDRQSAITILDQWDQSRLAVETVEYDASGEYSSYHPIETSIAPFSVRVLPKNGLIDG